MLARRQTLVVSHARNTPTSTSWGRSFSAALSVSAASVGVDGVDDRSDIAELSREPATAARATGAPLLLHFTVAEPTTAVRAPSFTTDSTARTTTTQNGRRHLPRLPTRADRQADADTPFSADACARRRGQPSLPYVALDRWRTRAAACRTTRAAATCPARPPKRCQRTPATARGHGGVRVQRLRARRRGRSPT